MRNEECAKFACAQRHAGKTINIATNDIMPESIYYYVVATRGQLEGAGKQARTDTRQDPKGE